MDEAGEDRSNEVKGDKSDEEGIDKSDEEGKDSSDEAKGEKSAEAGVDKKDEAEDRSGEEKSDETEEDKDEEEKGEPIEEGKCIYCFFFSDFNKLVIVYEIHTLSAVFYPRKKTLSKRVKLYFSDSLLSGNWKISNALKSRTSQNTLDQLKLKKKSQWAKSGE